MLGFANRLIDQNKKSSQNEQEILDKQKKRKEKVEKQLINKINDFFNFCSDGNDLKTDCYLEP